MRRLDQRGVASFEFCAVAVAFITLVYTIFDLGRYAITRQSLRALANAGARAMMIQCYTPALLGTPDPVTGTVPTSPPSSCTGNYMTVAQMQAVAPFLYAGGLTPTLTITAGASALTVTASEPGFTMLTPIWGSALQFTASNPLSASTQVPF
jgi:Flp pilus assembly protein TadG